MNSSHLSSKIILCIFLVIFPLTTISAQSPKAKLFGLLGLSVDTSVDEKLFDILVEKLEELGIKEEELSDGYEFMGGSSSLNNYINKNANRLLILMGGEIEDNVSDEKDNIKEDQGKNEE